MRKPDWCKGELINWFLLKKSSVLYNISFSFFFPPKHFWKIIRRNLFSACLSTTRIFFFFFSLLILRCNSTGLVIELKIRRRPRRATRWNLKCLLLDKGSFVSFKNSIRKYQLSAGFFFFYPRYNQRNIDSNSHS